MGIFRTNKQLREDLAFVCKAYRSLIVRYNRLFYAKKEVQCKLDRATCILQSFVSGETDEMIIAQEEAREFLKSVNRSVDNGNSNG